MFRVKVGDRLFQEASAPSKKAARQLAAEEAVKELMGDGLLHLNKVKRGLATVREERRKRALSKMERKREFYMLIDWTQSFSSSLQVISLLWATMSLSQRFLRAPRYPPWRHLSSRRHMKQVWVTSSTTWTTTQCPASSSTPVLEALLLKSALWASPDSHTSPSTFALLLCHIFLIFMSLLQKQQDSHLSVWLSTALAHNKMFISHLISSPFFTGLLTRLNWEGGGFLQCVLVIRSRGSRRQQTLLFECSSEKQRKQHVLESSRQRY